MGLRKTITKTTHGVIESRFSTRDGSAVPTSDMLRSASAVRLTGAFLCAEVTDSAGLVLGHPAETVAKVVRAFLTAVSQAAANRGGEIRGFDAGRITAVFTGDRAADQAARAALEIKWVVDNLVRPEVEQLGPVRVSGWVLRHGAGLDIGEVTVIRGGIRERNDVVIIGDAPGVAAWLSQLGGQRTHITERLWAQLSRGIRLSESNDDKPMWSEPQPVTWGSREMHVRSSNWGWVVP